MVVNLQMKRWKLISALVLIFASGLVCGAVGTTFYIKHRVKDFFAGGPERLHQFMLDRFTRELDLDEKQRDQMELIVAKIQMKLAELHLKNQKEIEEATKTVKEEARAFLNEKQMAKLLAMQEERRERWNRMFPSPDGQDERVGPPEMRDEHERRPPPPREEEFENGGPPRDREREGRFREGPPPREEDGGFQRRGPMRGPPPR